MRRGGGKGHEKPKNCQHYHVQNESEGNWGHAAVKANSNRLRPWHEAAWSSNEQEEQSQSHNFILCWYSTRKTITENIYCPLTRSSLITKLHMLFTTMFAYCISSSACCLDPCCLLRSFLSGWLFPREVGLENPGSVCEKESDAAEWCSYMDCTGHKLTQHGQTH